MTDFGAVVLDIGSQLTKAGFAGEDKPRRIMSSSVGRPRHPGIVFTQERDYFVGQDVNSAKGLLDVKSPVEHGVIYNWPDFTRLLEHLFKGELKVEPTEHCVLLTETPLNPRANREKTAEVLFEHFNVRGAQLSSQAALALYSSGRTSGLVLDSGHGVTHWVPIVEGHSLPQGIARMGYGGSDLNIHLGQMLLDTGFTFDTSEEKEILENIKEKLCYVAADAEERRGHIGESETYVMPDGRSISLNRERFLCPEALFDPPSMGLASVGLSEAAQLSVANCESRTLQRQMYENVVLSGGNTMFKGLKERLLKELRAKAGDSAVVKVIAPAERHYAAWTGGAIVATMSTFEHLWIRRAEYDEQGPRVVQRKSF